MQIRQFEYVEYVVRFGTMREAAKQLFVTEPTVSQQIRELEKEMGFQLFSKQGRGIHLTKEGEQLMPLIRNVIGSFHELERGIALIKEPDSGNIRFGTVPTGALTILPSLLIEFNRLYPKVVLDVVESGSIELIEQMQKGSLDAAIVATDAHIKLNYEDIEFRKLTSGKLMVVVPASHPFALQTYVSLEELATQRLILFRRGYLIREIVLSLLGPDIHNNIVYSTDNSESARNLVKAGVGVFLLPSYLIAHWSAGEPAGLRFLELKEQALNLDLCCIYRKNIYRPKFMEVFVKTVSTLARSLYFN